uniref:hypothetical protein n=1 Tax=Xylella fastidiosa TaxID=2371 RepID=UPI0019D42E2D
MCGLQGLGASGLDRHAIQGDITAAGVLEHDRGHGAAFSQKKAPQGAGVMCVASDSNAVGIQGGLGITEL